MAYDYTAINNSLNEVSLDLIRAINKLDGIRDIVQANDDAATMVTIDEVYSKLLEAAGDLDDHLGV